MEPNKGYLSHDPALLPSVPANTALDWKVIHLI